MTRAALLLGLLVMSTGCAFDRSRLTTYCEYPVLEGYQLGTTGDEPCWLFFFDDPSWHPESEVWRSTNFVFLEQRLWTWGLFDAESLLTPDVYWREWRYDNVALVCRKAVFWGEDERLTDCPALGPSERLSCSWSEDGTMAFSSRVGSSWPGAVSVEALDVIGAPDSTDEATVVVTWRAPSPQGPRPFVAWWTPDQPTPALDVCARCYDDLSTVSLPSDRPLRTLLRGRDLLMAAPCGVPEVVLLEPSGACFHTAVATPVSPQAVDVVALSRQGSQDWAWWTDGHLLWSTAFAEGSPDAPLSPASAVPHLPVLSGNSHGAPDMLCANGESPGGEGATRCVALWTRDQSSLESTTRPRDTSTWVAPLTLVAPTSFLQPQEGSAELPVSAQPGAMNLAGLAGRLCRRHPSHVDDRYPYFVLGREEAYGLMVRSLLLTNTADTPFLTPGQGRQLSASDQAGLLSAVETPAGGCLVSFFEPDRNGNPAVKLKLLSRPPEGEPMALRSLVVQNHALDSGSDTTPGDRAPASLMMALGRNSSSGEDVLLIANTVELQDQCVTRLAAFPFDEAAVLAAQQEAEVPLGGELDGVMQLETPGACARPQALDRSAECHGDLVDAGEGFLLALPSTTGVSVWSVAVTGAAVRVTSLPPESPAQDFRPGPACRASLWLSPSD